MKCGKPSDTSSRRSLSSLLRALWHHRLSMMCAAILGSLLVGLSSCATSKILYVGLRPSITPSPGILRLAEDEVSCVAPDNTAVTLKNAGGYYLIHESDLEVLLEMVRKDGK